MFRKLARVTLTFGALTVLAVASLGCDQRPADPPMSHAKSQATPVPEPLVTALARLVSTHQARVAAPRARVYPLTTDGRDRFLVHPDGADTLVQAASTNTGGNTRLVWVSPTGEISVDQQVCATWDAWSGLAQPGLALRVRGDGTRVRAITVTGNIVWGARFGFNVHQWDTAHRIGNGVPAVYAGGADLSRTFGPANGLVALPWHICARVRGRVLDFKVWPSSRPEPTWGDARYGRRIELSATAVYPGRAGWYAGHLRPGDKLLISDQVTRNLAH